MASLSHGFTLRFLAHPIIGPSELAVAHLESESACPASGRRAAQPVGDPQEQLPDRDARIAEQAMAQLPVAQQGVGRFGPGAESRAAEQLPQFLRQSPHAQQLRPGEVHHQRRRGNVAKGAQRGGVGIGLPDGIEVAQCSGRSALRP